MHKFQKHNIFNKFRLLLVYLFILLILSVLIYGNAGSYSLLSPVECGSNCSGGYEIYNQTYAYCDSNPIECFNTIDECKDGYITIDNVRQCSLYEWIENLKVTSLNGTNFTGGTDIEIEGIFDCDPEIDEIAFAYHNGTEWRNVYDDTCNDDDNVTFKINITLDQIKGIHTVRAIIAYEGIEDMICGWDADEMYSDTDDVSFYVYSYYELNPPNITDIAPLQGALIEYIQPKEIKISAQITDESSLDRVFANISWGLNNQILPMEYSDNDIYTGIFTNTNLTGRYNFSIFANDSNSNINYNVTSFFYFNKTSKIYINYPENLKWYPENTILLDFIIKSNETVNSSYYVLNNNLVYLNNSFKHKNDQLTNISLINTSNFNNISQSFNISINFTLTSIKLHAKRIGEWNSNITIQIRNDSGNNPGNILTVVNQTNIISNLTFEWKEFNILNPIELIQNKQYWIYLEINDSISNYTQFTLNNETYSNGALLQNNSKDLLFILEDTYHYIQNISVNQTINNITSYANITSNSTILYSPTVDFYYDNIPPVISQVNYLPDESESLDPLENINISVNITDVFNISNAILEYKSHNASNWSTTDMSKNSSIYYSNFTPIIEGNWTFRIFANDTNSNFNYSDNLTLVIIYETDYEINLTNFNNTIGMNLETNNSLGEIIIKNTGDKNLLLNISKASNLDPILTFNNDSSKLINISPGNTEYIEVIAFSPDYNENLPYTINIETINYNIINKTINGTIIICSNGPCIYVDITGYQTSVENLNPITFTAEIINYGNETAHNVSAVWQLPDVWMARENTTKIINELLPGELNKYKYSLSIKGSSILTLGTLEIILTACNNFSNNSDSVDVQVYSKLSSPNYVPSSGGGDNPPSYITSYIEVGKPELSINAPVFIEMMRGDKIEFYVNITNNESINITNVSIGLEGFIFSYITLEPNFIKDIGSDETKKIYVNIEAPLYLNEGIYPINFNTQFMYNNQYINNTKEIKLIILTKNNSIYLDCIINTEKELNYLKDSSFNIEMISELLLLSKNDILEKDYVSSLKNCEKAIELISYAKSSKMEFEKIKKLSNSLGVKSINFNSALKLANEAIKNGDYELANSRIMDATVLLEIEKSFISSKINRFKNNFINNLHIIIPVFIIIILFFTLLYARISITHINNRINKLIDEENVIINLIKSTQKNRFKDKSISRRLYEKQMGLYRQKLADIQWEKNLLRIKIHQLKGESKQIRLNKQKELIIKLKKQIQNEFYITKVIDEKSYNKMKLEYDHILSEIDDDLAMIKNG